MPRTHRRLRWRSLLKQEKEEADRFSRRDKLIGHTTAIGSPCSAAQGSPAGNASQPRDAARGCRRKNDRSESSLPSVYGPRCRGRGSRHPASAGKVGRPPVSLPEPPRLPGSSPDPTPSGQPLCGFPSLPFFARLLPQAEPASQGPANVRSAATRKRVKCTCFYKVFAADPRLSRGNAQANIYKPTGPMPKGIGPVLTTVSFQLILIPARADSP